MHSAFHLRPSELTGALAAVKAATNTRSAITALTGVRLVAHDGTARMYATDMEVHVRRDLADVTVSGPLDVLVSHAELAKAAKLLAAEDLVTIAHEPAPKPTDAQVIVRGAKRTIRLRPLRLEDFPSFPATTYARHVLSAPAGAFAEAIKRSAVFASKDETRPVLTGIFLTAKAFERAELVATDSFRLSVIGVDRARALYDFEVNVRAAGLKLTTRNMKDGDVFVHVVKPAPDALPLGITVTNPAAGEEWFVRAIDGQFPNYRQLIPDVDAFDHELRVPTAELRSAFELASAMLKANAPARIKLDTTALVHGFSPDGPSFEEQLEHAQHQANGATAALEIGVNPDFALDATKITRGEELTIRFITPLRPCLWEDGDDRFLLMPIRLNV